MATHPSFALSDYQRTARSLTAKSALPLAAGAVATFLSAPAAVAQTAFALHPTTGNIAAQLAPLFIDFETFAFSHTPMAGFDLTLSVDNCDPDDTLSSTVGGPQLTIAATVADDMYVAQKLAGSVLLDTSFNFAATHSGYFNGYYGNVRPEWAGASGGFIGLNFLSLDDNSSHFGWLQVSTNADASEITLLGFGFNQTPGASILTGEGVEYAPTPVPEPATSAALLALGAAGLVAYRRRKNLQRAA